MPGRGELRIRFVGDTRDFDRTAGGLPGKLQGIGDKMRRIGNTMSIAVTAPILLGFNKMADAASDLGESVNAVNVVFGKAADKIHAFGKVAATEAGLSRRAFNELVTPVGAMFRNFEFGAEEAAEASIDVTKRAADMASIFNVDVSEALEAAQAGFRGESEQLRRFGVDLSEASVKAFAVREGLIKVGEEMDNNVEAQARLGLFMEQTDRLAGDFKDTSDELANSQRIAAARAEDLAAAFGEKLLPLKQRLLEFGTRLIEIFENLSPAMQDATLVALAVAAAIGPVVRLFAALIGVIRGVTIGLVLLATHPAILAVAGVLGSILLVVLALRDGFQGLNQQVGIFLGRQMAVGQALGRGLGNIANLPKFHHGGVFRAPSPGGVGLALLRDREGIFTPEQMAAGARPAGGGGSGRFVFDGPVTLSVGDQSFKAWIRGIARREVDDDRRFHQQLNRVYRSTPGRM
jgi:hypothetical protein